MTLLDGEAIGQDEESREYREAEEIIRMRQEQAGRQIEEEEIWNAERN